MQKIASEGKKSAGVVGKSRGLWRIGSDTLLVQCGVLRRQDGAMSLETDEVKSERSV